jgi:glycosyltransferase involved in cell wall biosynthesis
VGAAPAKLGAAQGNGFFFVLSNPKPHKNLPLLKRAYARARAQRASLPTLVLSTPGGTAEGILPLPGLSAPEIGFLLREARAVFFPSLYEGFGRPPLEAALLGTLPVVSDIPVHREVLSGVPEAIFVDPRREEAWTAEFLKHGDRKESVSDASRQWVEQTYAAGRLAQTMTEFYRRGLGI